MLAAVKTVVMSAPRISARMVSSLGFMKPNLTLNKCEARRVRGRLTFRSASQVSASSGSEQSNAHGYQTRRLRPRSKLSHIVSAPTVQIAVGRDAARVVL